MINNTVLQILFPREKAIYQERFRLISHIALLAIAFCIPLSTSYVEILSIIAICAGFCAGMYRNFSERWSECSIVYLVLILYCVLILSITYTTAPLNLGFDYFLKYKKLLYLPLFIPLFDGERVRQNAIYAFLGGVFLASLMSYGQFFGFLHYRFPDSPASYFKQRIDTNMLMAVATYLTACLVISEKRFRIAGLIFIAVLTVNVFYLSRGRSGYFSYLILSLIFFWHRLSHKRFLFAIGSLLTILGLFFMTSKNFQQRIQYLQSDIVHYRQGDARTSLGLRLHFEEISYQIFKHHPILGTGIGSYIPEYERYDTASLASGNPHSEYCHLMVQLGVLGLIIFLVLFYRLWRESYQLPRQQGRLARAFVVLYLIGCLLNSWMMDVTEGFLFSYFIALCFSTWPAAALSQESKEFSTAISSGERKSNFI